MIVFFASSNNPNKEEVNKRIIQVIKERGDELIVEGDESYYSLIDPVASKNLPQDGLRYIYTQKAINKATAIIIEASEDDFNMGHEATMALLFKKPVLCISTEKDYSKDIVNNLFYGRIYTKVDELYKIINNFLDNVKKKHKAIRKNIYITPLHANFLAWFAKNTNKSDSEIIRSLIEELMAKNPDYNTQNL